MSRRSFLSWSAPAALLLGLFACGNPAGPGSSGAAPSASAAVESDVLVTVNGVPIRANELYYVMARKKGSRGGPNNDPAALAAALDELVDQEIARQAAAAAGIAADAEYRKKLAMMEAPFVQFQREELAQRYLRREAAAKRQVDEAELRKYFDAHTVALKTELHLYQIMVRNDENRIREMKKSIDGGAAFEAAAATLFPKLPQGSAPPWDIGVMRWSQVPAGWRTALEKMKEGEVSDVIAGPKGRFWIVKLVKRQVNEALTFDQLKPEITELIQAEKGTGLQQKIKAELRQKAKVVRVREAGPPPAADHDD